MNSGTNSHHIDCAVHGSVAECCSTQKKKLQIALALVILRDKPFGQEARNFVTDLQTYCQNKDLRWKAEYHRLKQEVLMLRQQQILFDVNGSSIYSTPPAGIDTNGVVFGGMVPTPNMLTPPNSQSTSSDISELNENNEDQGADQMEFLRAYFFLEHQLRNPSSTENMLENDAVRKSICSILDQVNFSLNRNSVDFPRCLEGLRLCVRLLERHSKWIPVVPEIFYRPCASWLQSILFNCNNSDDSYALKVFTLLQILVGSSILAPLISESLLKLMAESQIHLMDWDVTKFLPQILVNILSGTSYLVLLMEKALPRLSSTDRKRLLVLFPHIEPRIQQNFPLLASSLIRLQTRLSI